MKRICHGERFSFFSRDAVPPPVKKLSFPTRDGVISALRKIAGLLDRKIVRDEVSERRREAEKLRNVNEANRIFWRSGSR